MTAYKSLFRPFIVVHDDGGSVRMEVDLADCYVDTYTAHPGDGATSAELEDAEEAHGAFLDEILGDDRSPAAMLRRLADYLEGPNR